MKFLANFLLTLYCMLYGVLVHLFLYPLHCVSVRMQEIYQPYLDTLAIIYPFILLLLTYAAIQLHSYDCKLIVSLWRLLHRPYIKIRRTWDPNASMLQAFAAILFISTPSLFFLCMSLFYFQLFIILKIRLLYTHVT